MRISGGLVRGAIGAALAALLLPALLHSNTLESVARGASVAFRQLTIRGPLLAAMSPSGVVGIGASAVPAGYKMLIRGFPGVLDPTANSTLRVLEGGGAILDARDDGNVSIGAGQSPRPGPGAPSGTLTATDIFMRGTNQFMSTLPDHLELGPELMCYTHQDNGSAYPRCPFNVTAAWACCPLGPSSGPGKYRTAFLTRYRIPSQSGGYGSHCQIIDYNGQFTLLIMASANDSIECAGRAAR